MKKTIIEYSLTVIIAVAVTLGIYCATIRTEVEVKVVPTVHNAIIETLEWKTDIFGHRVLVGWDIEKLNPYSD